MRPVILYEDKEIIVCEKKPGMPVQSDRSLDMDLLNQIRNYLHEQSGQQELYVGLVHRLDRPVGGVIVFAKTPQAAKELSRQVQAREIKKEYLCIVEKDLSEQVGAGSVTLEDYMVKDAKNNISKIVPSTQKGSKRASLSYEVLEVCDGRSLLKVELHTGRHHQIRLQMATHVAGLLGDRKYNAKGSTVPGNTGVALYAHALTLVHPKTKKMMCIKSLPKGTIWEVFRSIYSKDDE